MSITKTATKKTEKSTSKKTSGSANSAPRNALMAAPETTSKKRQYLRSAAIALCLLIWTWASVWASQFFVALIMEAMLGWEKLLTPVPIAIHSALSYTLALMLVIISPFIVTRPLEKRYPVERPADSPDASINGRTRFNIAAERNRLGLKGLPTWTDIGLSPIAFIVYLILALILISFFSIFPWFDSGQSQNVGFDLMISGSDRVVAFLTLVVVAPIAEEMIFRGWLYGRLRDQVFKKFKTAWRIGLSVFLTSALFGILHGQWNVGVNVFALSVVLCGLREFTGTIYSGILLHMLKNGIAFYSLFVAGIG